MEKSKTIKVFKFICKHCGKEFIKTEKELNKSKHKTPVFCCKECQKEWYKENSYITVKCKNCGKEFQISKGVYNKSETKNFFCSHSCSATYNNSKRIISEAQKKKTSETFRKKLGIEIPYNENDKICPKCGNKKDKYAKLCSKCLKQYNRDILKNRTLGSYIDGHKYLSTKCGEIRRDARKTIEESKREKVCEYCHNHEFDDILEVHHLKGILEFDRSATVAEINDINNLVWLCPNHHKMLEMGLITL